jgi:hypothetical protein
MNRRVAGVLIGLFLAGWVVCAAACLDDPAPSEA